MPRRASAETGKAGAEVEQVRVCTDTVRNLDRLKKGVDRLMDMGKVGPLETAPKFQKTADHLLDVVQKFTDNGGKVHAKVLRDLRKLNRDVVSTTKHVELLVAMCEDDKGDEEQGQEPAGAV